MSLIRIDDTKFYYESHGRGQPLVLIAGYSCDHTFWDLILEKLSKEFTVFIFDNRGIGQTKDATTLLTLEGFAQDTINLMRSLNLKQPILLGQSMGGAIAQIIANQYQDIKKLILLNTACKLNQRSLMTLSALLKVFKENVSFDTLLDVSIPWFFSDKYLSSSENITYYKEKCRNNPFPPTIEILERQLNALKRFNSELWIHHLNVPTLVVASEQDIICLPSESQKLAEQIPNASFMHISGGHASTLESPLAILQAIKSFCN